VLSEVGTLALLHVDAKPAMACHMMCPTKALHMFAFSAGKTVCGGNAHHLCAAAR